MATLSGINSYPSNVAFNFCAYSLSMLSSFFCDHGQVLNFILVIALEIFKSFSESYHDFGGVFGGVRHVGQWNVCAS